MIGEPVFSDDDAWKMIRTLFGPEPAMTLLRHQHDSFSDFVTTKIRAIMEGFNPIELHNGWIESRKDYEVKIKVVLSNAQLIRPTTVEPDGSTHSMTPTEARRRGLTYASQMYVDVDIDAYTLSGQAGEEPRYVHDHKKLSNVALGRIPVMVRSEYCIHADFHMHAVAGECPNDPGGYFIVSGSERALISHDRMAENRTFVFTSNKCTAFTHSAEVRSLCAGDFGVPKITGLKISSKNNEAGKYVHVTAHHVRVPIPLFVLFRVFGIESDKQIFDMIVGNNAAARANIHILAGCAVDAAQINVFTQDDAERYMLSCTTLTGCPREYCLDPAYERKALRRMLKTEILPHVGEVLAHKASYLAEMARLLLLVSIGLRDPDDRDSYVNKRVDAPGVMLANLLRQYFGKVVKEARKALYKELNGTAWRASGSAVNVVNSSNVFKIFKGLTIESGMRYALATGTWGVKSGSKQGVSQVLNRLTYCATLSHLRRVSTSIEKNSKLVQPRKLNGTQWGVFCPAETPEGQSVGVVKNLSLSVCITVATSAASVVQFLNRTFPTGIDPTVFTGGLPCPGGATIRVNSSVWGKVGDASSAARVLRAAKKSGRLHPHTAVVWKVEDGEIAICTEGGRMVRPLMPVTDGVPDATRILDQIRSGDTTAVDLITAGALEYLDVEEIGHTYVAMTLAELNERHTHVELHASLALGILASFIPFPDHNQSPRNSYQSAMGKQAIGLPMSNYLDRFDIGAHIMDYLQKPLVSSRSARMLGADEMPAGMNAIVAICTCQGYNQEDAVIMNKSAAQRGLFTSTYYHTVREQLAKNHSSGEEEIYYTPDSQAQSQLNMMTMTHNYGKLQADGFPLPGTLVGTGDVIIGKGMPTRGESVTDSSVVLRNNEGGFIDRLVHSNQPYRTTNGDGYSFCKVRILDPRVPQIGDKLSSRSGQKGTIGMLVRQEDMPFTADGIVPDVIINPHAIPSRMTVGQLLEALLGKAACMAGQFGDGTPFSAVTPEAVAEQLRSRGMEMFGDEVMHDPRTGAQMPVAVFMAPTYYQRLKHMVRSGESLPPRPPAMVLLYPAPALVLLFSVVVPAPALVLLFSAGDYAFLQLLWDVLYCWCARRLSTRCTVVAARGRSSC